MHAAISWVTNTRILKKDFINPTEGTKSSLQGSWWSPFYAALGEWEGEERPFYPEQGFRLGS